MMRHGPCAPRAVVVLACAAALGLPLVVALQAQSGAGAPLAFEVASVKINKSGDAGMRMAMQPGGRVTVSNVPLRQLIVNAYDVQPFQVIGGPDWVASDRFDIVARAPDGTPQGPDTMGPMLQALLTDRFELKVRRETREMPTYELTVARTDGRLGPRLKRSDTDCDAMRGRGAAPPGGPGGAGAGTGRGGPLQPPAPGEIRPCAMMMGVGRFTGGGLPLTALTRAIGPRVGRFIVDKTGLTGAYDFDVEFTPDQMPNLPAGGLVNGAPLPAADGPSLFTALQEQLGLKLESSRGPVDVVVIESVERPMED